MVKRLLFFTIALVFLQISEVFSQISIGTVDAGPYGYGSHITVPIIIPSAAPCLPRTGNLFQLYLSDETGNFANERLIGSYSGFYTNFINGVIPTTTPALVPGSNYKLRVKITGDNSIIEYPTPIAIQGVTMPDIGAEPSSTAQILGPDTYGFCGSSISDGKNIILTNKSATTVSTELVVKNEISGSTQTYTSGPAGFQVANLANSYYTARLNGNQTISGILIKSNKSYLLLNSSSKVSIQSTGDGFGCIDPATGNMATVSYFVTLNGASGILNNYPGSTYRINWGDGTNPDLYTHCELVEKNGTITHNFTQTSCGQPPIDLGGGNQVTNAFRISVTTINPYCTSDPNSALSYAKIYVKPIARINPPLPIACVNQTVTFNNGTISGYNSNCSRNMLYEWYVDGQLMSTSETFSYAFPTNGQHVVKLVAKNDVGICSASEDTFTICVQNPPQPAFDIIGATTGCAPFTVNVQDKSIIDPSCSPPPNHIYNWIVTNANGVEFTNFTDGIPNPEFNLTEPGVYTIALEITSGSCGVFRTVAPDPIVIINGPAVAILSPDRKLCTLRTYKFDDVPNTPTTTVLTGTQVTLADTYTWEVTGANGEPLTSADYTFEDNTGPNTKYPSINFKINRAYKITVTHKNTCNPAGVTDSQILEFFPAPQIDVGPDQTICYLQNNVTLNAAITGTITSGSWVGGTGTFGDRNSPNTTYTPTALERANGVANPINLSFVANTELQAPCNTVSDALIIIIKPEIKIISSPTASVCTENMLNYSPASNLPNTLYKWTASGSTNASGYTSNTVPKNIIEDVLVNTDAGNNVTVTYLITPVNDGCDGDPFTLTVTVTPRPILISTPAAATICSGQGSAITLSVINTPGPTRYTWTSVATNGPTNTVSGNLDSSTPTAVTIIDHPLINNGTAQGTVTYTITPHSASGCPGDPVIVTINVDPAVTASVAGPVASICNTGSYTLEGNQPKSNETGTWTWVPGSGQSGVTIQNPNSPNAVAAGLVAGQQYVFTWTISSPGVCNSSSSSVTITVNEPTVPGTTTGTPSTVCAGTNSGTITLSGNLGSVIRWEYSLDGTSNWTAVSGTNTGTTYAFSDLITTTYYRAIVQNGQCNDMPSTATMITVSPASTIAEAGQAQVLCAEPGTTLAANTPDLAKNETGLWTIPSGAPSAFITDPANPNTTVSNLLAGQTYRFVWTITGIGACGPTSDEVTITNNLPIIQNISSTSAVVCNGQEVTLNGSTPTGGDGTNYIYSWEIKVDAGSWDVINNANDKDLIITLTTPGTVLFRRTVTSGGCTSTSNEQEITVRLAITGNSIAADQIICSGIRPEPMTGQPPVGGGGTYTYQWQSSPDGSAWTDIGGANASDYQPLALTATTFFRRAVTTTDCGSLRNFSNAIKITFNPTAKAEFTWANDKGCVPFTLPVTVVPYADRNATYTWYANTTVIGTGTTFPVYTIQNSNESVTIRLVATSSLGCSQDEFSHVFSTNQAVPASFTQSSNEGCGPLPINFTNASDLTAGATFLWNFGNGTTSTQANPGTVTYEAEATGKDTTYVITLTATTSCGSNSVTSTVLVKAKPIAIFSPSRTDGCSPMLVNFTNTSPGVAGTTYFYDFGDGSPVIQRSDKSPVQHTYNTTVTTTFRATLTVVTECGTDIRAYNIRVAPQNITPELVVDADEKEGCAPHTVNFDNNSIGASRFVFDFGDGNTQTTLSPGRVPHVYTTPGTFIVTMTAYNSCSEISTTETVTVLPQPIADFDALTKLGCTGLAVKFTNNTQNGVSYLWDFGDGSPTSSEFEPTHTYTGTQEYYTVTLTAINNLGCPMTVTKTDFIHIVQPPVAAFNVNPSTLISIPDYTFNFEDQSTNTPTIWEWDFGDGTSSALRNPSHTYLDTGTYRVTLKTINQQGCFSTTFKNVTIKGVPGYLFVPNSFIPGDTRPELREFRAKGSGIATWRFSIFNKWGQLLWETTKLEEGRPAEGWDGSFKGQPMPQGVYFWKIDVQLVNGSEWKGMTYDKSPPKRTGPIHLIR